MMTKTKALILLLLVLSSHSIGEEANWSQWRGPNENGSVENSNPPVEWGLDKNIRWKIDLPGKGSSTPIIFGNQVIVLTAVETERGSAPAATVPAATVPAATVPAATVPAATVPAAQAEPANEGGKRRNREPAPTKFYKFMVLSYDRESGAQQWEREVAEQVPHESGHKTNNFASSSPITDGKFIYVDFGSRGIHCLDMKGNIVWSVDLGKMKTVATFGEGASATLAKGKLIVPWDHEAGSFLVALDGKTGNELWRTTRDEQTCWSTPLVVDHEGRTQVITNGRKIRSYDLEDGSLIWECGGQTSNPIPSPVLVGDHVVCMTGYKGSAIQSISLDSRGDVTGGPSVAWSQNQAAPYVPSPTLANGVLYLNKGNEGIVTSIDAKTGQTIIAPARLEGIDMIYASPVSAGDYVYFTGRNGTTNVLKQGESLNIVAKNSLDETIDGSLAIVGDSIFIRGEKHLFKIEKL